MLVGVKTLGVYILRRPIFKSSFQKHLWLLTLVFYITPVRTMKSILTCGISWKNPGLDVLVGQIKIPTAAISYQTALYETGTKSSLSALNRGEG